MMKGSDLVRKAVKRLRSVTAAIDAGKAAYTQYIEVETSVRKAAAAMRDQEKRSERLAAALQNISEQEGGGR